MGVLIMMRRRGFLGLGTVTLAPASLSDALAQSTREERRIAVIVARSSPVSDVSLGHLRRIFLSQSRELGGQRVVPFNQARSTLAREVFDARVLHMGPEQSARYWVDQRIRGSSKPPRTISDPRLLLRVVSKFPGAIAYFDEDAIEGPVKALTVSGRSLSDAAYPIVGREDDR